MKEEVAVKRLSELGHSTRFAIFRLLMKAGRAGLSVGEIQQHLELAGATLSHHLHRLIAAGLVTQERDGRTLYCYAQLQAMRDVVDFLDAECCTLKAD